MTSDAFSPLRSRAARKPWPQCPEVVIYRCAHCHALHQALSEKPDLPAPACCGSTMQMLEPRPCEQSDKGMEYKVVGGFNQSAVQVFWEGAEQGDRLEWVLLRTFTGWYIKYLSEKKRPPLVFPLSDEDAYVYCDREFCQRCVFRCKRGFIVYAYFSKAGLLEMPLERMDNFFQVKK